MILDLIVQRISQMEFHANKNNFDIKLGKNY